MEDVRQRAKSPVGHLDHGAIRLHRARRVAGDIGAGARQRIEERRLARLWQPDDADSQCHGTKCTPVQLRPTHAMPRAVDDARGHCLQYSTRSPLSPRWGEGDPAGYPSSGQIAGGRRHRVKSRQRSIYHRRGDEHTGSEVRACGVAPPSPTLLAIASHHRSPTIRSQPATCRTGRAKPAASSASSPPVKTWPASPTSASTRSSIAARRARASPAATEDDVARLPALLALATTRSSTTGASRLENAQPFVLDGTLGTFALAHNGNLTNTLTLRDRLLARGEKLTTASDSEIIARMVAMAPGATYVQKLQQVMPLLQGAYSLALLAPDQVLAIRDPFGVRPLALGRLQDHWVIASETCAIETVGGEPLRDIAPGEIVVLSGDGEGGLCSHVGQASRASAACLFEYIYFARPDSSISDRSLYLARQRLGAELAHEFAVPADLVIGVPDSATPAAAGYAAARGLPYADGLIKNRDIGRPLMQPCQRLRQLGVKLKFNALNAVLGGKRVVMLDHSVVRATTIPPLLNLLPHAASLELHLA